MRPRCPGRRGRGQLRGELRKEGAWEKGGAQVQGQAWRARTWFTGRLALPSLLGPASRGALVTAYIWTGGRPEGRFQSWADLRGRFPRVHCRVCRSPPVDADTHRNGLTLGVHTRGIRSLCWSPTPTRTRAHTLADTIPRPSQGQTPGQPGGNWKFQSSLGSTNTVWRLCPQSPLQGGGAPWPMG